MAAAGLSEFVVVLLLLFGGHGAIPVGVPLPPDAGLQSAVPPKALVYVSHSGSTAPDAKSTNQIEQLLAEPEIQGFLGEVKRLIDEGLKRVPANNEKEKILTAALPVIGKTLLVRPSMFYLSEVKVPPEQPTGNAAFVVAAGDQVEPLTAALEELERLLLMNVPPNQTIERTEVGGAKLHKMPMPPGAPPVVWGVKDQYVFIAVGEQEAETIVARLTAKAAPPEWLAQLQAELDLKRTSGLFYFNAQAVIAQAEPLLKQFARAPPPLDDVSKLLDISGLRHLKHIALAAGLNDTVAVSKVLIAHDGTTAGLLDIGQAKPLTAADFKTIPRNADIAFVGRFAPQGMYARLLELVEKVEPGVRKKTEAQLAEADEQLGFSIQNDLLAGLGDTWTFYNSSEEGGLLLTGLCASVGVRDQAKLEKVIEQALRIIAAQVRTRDDQPAFGVRKTEVDGKTISFIQVTAEVSPVAPAWCFTDDRLIFALSPQMVRASISRPESEGSLGDIAEVAEHLKTGDVTSLSYSDTTLLLRFGYSYAQYIATLGASALEKEIGIRTDISKFPSLGSIRRHMRPAVSVTRQTKTGILLESYATGPSIDAVTVPFVVGAGAGLLVPAVQKARETAASASSLNNLRQITLAMILYATEKGTLPPRVIKSPAGKPLLSWRVAILPYLDENALYEQFHLDEPWDSEHNKTLLKLMPKAYAHPGAGGRPGASNTQYQIPTGKGTVYDASQPPKLEDGKAFGEGTSNTILIVETSAEKQVPWSKPDDITLTSESPADDLNRNRNGTINVGFADGSVRGHTIYDLEALRSALFPRAEQP
ncbi:MAG: DUF1559 domain-containing protein [Planctomycetia bacterium]|nr:DUF1559 domain-containing protein [Planctomycetia bacterium]